MHAFISSLSYVPLCISIINAYLCDFQVGDSWFTKDDCTERCVCSPFNTVTCEAWQCGPAQECKVNEGELGCVNTGTYKSLSISFFSYLSIYTASQNVF